MALNYPGPYEVRIYYTVNLLQHSQRLNVRISGTPAPGTAFADIDSLRRDDSPFALSDEVDDWVTLLRPFLYSASSTIDYAELWKYEPNSFDASFISVYPIGVAGTGATTQVAAAQMIWVFRTTEGGVMKVSIMEPIYPAAARIPYSSMNAAQAALSDAITNGTSPWLARDTSYPFAVTGLYPGQNEALFKKRYRTY